MPMLAIFFAAMLLITGCQASLPEQASIDDAAMVDTSGAPAYYYFSAAQLKLKQGDINEAMWLIDQAIRVDPNSTYLQLELANLMLVKKEDRRALKLVEKVMAMDPDNPRALAIAGQIYQQQGNTEAAISAYEKALNLQPMDQNLYLVVGRLHWNKHDLDRAEDTFRKMTVNIPDSYAAFYFYGKVLAAQGKSEDAERALLKSLELEPDIEEPLVELLEIYKDRNKPDKVTATYQDIIRHNPQNYQAIFGLAQHYRQMNQEDASLDLLKALAGEVQGDNRIVAALFEMYLEKKRYAEAAWAIQGMLDQIPDNSDLHYLAAMAYDGLQQDDQALAHMLKVAPGSRFYTNAVVHSAMLFHDKGEISRAIDQVRKAVEHDPGHVDYYLYLGSFYEELERFDDALSVLREGMRRDNRNARLYFRLGVVLDKMGRKQESIAAMKRVLVLTPDDAEALNYLGYTYADLGINLDEAESLILSALALKPDDGYITDSLGWVYFKRGKYIQALEMLNKAVKLVPDDPTILEHLGDVYRKMQRNEKALEYYLRSLDKRDNGRESLEDKIRQLSGN